MHSYAFSSIFHAFNMRYSRIAEIAPSLREMGFTHVQFPPIQPTRELTPLDIPLLQKQVKNYTQQLSEFATQCSNAAKKNADYAPHTFDYLLQKRTYYIREPTFRHWHRMLLEGVPYDQLEDCLQQMPPYRFVFRNELQELIDSDVSIVVKLMASIQSVGSSHPYFFLLEIADILRDPIMTNEYQDPSTSVRSTELEYNTLQSEIRSLRSQGVKHIPETLLKQVSAVKKKRSQYKTLLDQYTRQSQQLEKLKQCTEPLQILKERIMAEVDLVSELKSLHAFGTNKRQKKTTDVRVWMDCIYLLETLLFSPWWLIYQPLSLKMGSTFLGSKEDIMTGIAACKKHGLAVIADVVINNLAAVGGEKESWAPSVFPGKQTLADCVSVLSEPFQKIQGLLLNGFGVSDLKMITPPYPCSRDQEPTHCWMSGALPQLVQTHPTVQCARKQFLEELRAVGVDGVRIDAAVHLEPWVCEEVLTSMPGLSYIEYVTQFNPSHKHSPESYAHLRLEDLAIGEDLFASIFSDRGDLERTTNFGSLRLRRAELDSVVMIVNHDHMMGSIPSNVFSMLPSKVTYELSLAYLIQRIYGQVLLMPHDIEFPFVQKALSLRKKMQEMQVVSEYVHIVKETGTLYIEKFNTRGEILFVSILHLGSSDVYTPYGHIEPHSFVWFSDSETGLVYNSRQHTWLRTCYDKTRKQRKSRKQTRKLAKHVAQPNRKVQNQEDRQNVTAKL